MVGRFGLTLTIRPFQPLFRQGLVILRMFQRFCWNVLRITNGKSFDGGKIWDFIAVEKIQLPSQKKR
jgi:hypothetical protein